MTEKVQKLMMVTSIVKSEEEFNKARDEAYSNGYRIASISNTGLPEGHFRITFLDQSCFKDEGGDEDDL